MTAYRPSARIKLTLRTEEFDDTAELDARLPDPFTDVPNPSEIGAPAVPPATSPAGSDLPTDLLALNSERRAALIAEQGSIPADEYPLMLEELNAERQAILRDNTSPATEDSTVAPEAVSGRTTDDLTVIGNIEPLSVQIERNGLASADTARVTIDYIDAPIDPRILRAAHCEIVLGIVSADDFEAGMERLEQRSDGSLRSLVAVPETDATGPFTRFVGFVDAWDQEYGEKGDTISLELRDNSAPMRDLKLLPGLSIDLSLPIDQGIEGLLAVASATTRGVRCVYRGEGDAPVPADVAPTSRRRPRRGRRARRARTNGAETSIWDHITDVVVSVGLVPIMDGFDVALISPRTQYGSQDARRMVYGRNLERLAFSRRLQGVKVPTIEVRCYDADLGRTRWARWPTRSGERRSGVMGIDNPPRPLRANEVPPSGSNPDESVKTYTVSGITDPAFLEQIAESIFEQLGRQEIEGNFVTGDAWSYEALPDDGDLLGLTAGDAVELLLARADSTDDENVGANPTLARIQAMDRARRRDYMIALGWEETVAARFAALQDATGFQTVFRIQDVRFDWDNDSGLRTSANFINFITVREEAASS